MNAMLSRIPGKLLRPTSFGVAESIVPLSTRARSHCLHRAPVVTKAQQHVARMGVAPVGVEDQTLNIPESCTAHSQGSVD